MHISPPQQSRQVSSLNIVWSWFEAQKLSHSQWLCPWCMDTYWRSLCQTFNSQSSDANSTSEDTREETFWWVFNHTILNHSHLHECKKKILNFVQWLYLCYYFLKSGHLEMFVENNTIFACLQLVLHQNSCSVGHSLHSLVWSDHGYILICIVIVSELYLQ